MSKITQLANEIEQEYARLLEEVKVEKESQVLLKKSLNDKKKSLDEREVLIAAKESEVSKREKDCEDKLKKVRRDDQVSAEYEETMRIKDSNEKAMKELRELMADNNYTVSEIHRMQAELNEEKRTYKEKLEAEFQETLKNLIK